MKLNQVIAMVSGLKSRVKHKQTEIYHKLQKDSLTQGITRTYHPINEEGEQLPPEKKNVQYTVHRAIDEIKSVLPELWDAVATMDKTNQIATGDIVINGETIAEGLPVTFLLMLEKELQDLRTQVSKFTVLDLAETWDWSDVANCYVSDPRETVRTKKVPVNHIKYEATKEHPAQVEVFMEDVPVGRWETVKLSGGIPEKTRGEIIDRIDALIAATKCAREQANTIDAVNVRVAKNILDFVFEPVTK